MLLLTPRYYIFLWGWSLFSLSIFFLFLFGYILTSSLTFHILLDVFLSSEYTLTLSLTLDLYSSLFSFVVSFISSVVFFFLSHYFHSFINITYFSWLTFLFILSMLILINFTDLFFIMLGWDGLGVVSFFLILYYQSPISVYSSLFTLLMNRIGDCLFVTVIVLFFYSSSFLGFYVSSYTSFVVSLLLVFTLITKSALFPFSPWLPAAIAAPTPISSLVHSSTLVTAGLYIIIRNFTLLSSSSGVLELLIIIGLFTSFYAGLSALVEPDLKNVVALSTLSHLGFICFALGLGWCLLAFFHLLSHAFFKSSLFISLGSYISSHYHYQDSRLLSTLSLLSPSISSVIALSEFSLIGFPFVSGFYSNDFILESFSYSSISIFLVFVVYFNLLLTYSYVFRILSSLTSHSNIPSFLISPQFTYTFLFMLSTLSLLSLVFGLLFYITFPVVLTIVTPFFKFFPFLLLTTFLFLWVGFNFSLNPSQFSLSIGLVHFFGYIVYLSPFWTNIMAKFFFSFSSSLHRMESGLFSSVAFSWVVDIYFYVSSYVYYFYSTSFNYSSFSTIFVLLLVLLYIIL